jgi:hypothetical protein
LKNGTGRGERLDWLEGREAQRRPVVVLTG